MLKNMTAHDLFRWSKILHQRARNYKLLMEDARIERNEDLRLYYKDKWHNALNDIANIAVKLDSLDKERK